MRSSRKTKTKRGRSSKSKRKIAKYKRAAKKVHGRRKQLGKRLNIETLIAGMACSDGWQTTGYYTPVESDFRGPLQEIYVAGRGRQQFPIDFLREVRMEGWGRTRYNWYLGFNNGQYRSAAAPLNALGKPLREGRSLAVDKNEIPFGTSVRIVNLPPPWDNQPFVADDVGSMIHSQHVDVYCGEGARNKQRTYQVTRNNRRLCRS